MERDYTFPQDKASVVLDMMGNAGRLRILELISAAEWDVGSLAQEVNLSQSALSQHLRKLRDAKLVTTRRQAQTVYYSCTSPAVAKVLKTLREIYSSPTSRTEAGVQKKA